jgi:hypothetical protein
VGGSARFPRPKLSRHRAPPELLWKPPARRGARSPQFPGNTRKGIAESRLSPTDQERYLRAEAANDNGFVGLGFFAAAVVAGNVARLPNAVLNRAVNVYLTSRVAYNLLYILGTNSEWHIGIERGRSRT